LREWVTRTPEDRRLVVRRSETLWIARCGEAGVGRSAVLDVALAEAVRADTDLVAHSSGVDYGAWVRTLADRIEMEFRQQSEGEDPRESH
jgi:hypothetical protein